MGVSRRLCLPHLRLLSVPEFARPFPDFRRSIRPSFYAIRDSDRPTSYTIRKHPYRDSSRVPIPTCAQALAAAGVAWADGGLEALDRMRCGILIGSALGGMKTFSNAIETLHSQARRGNTVYEVHASHKNKGLVVGKALFDGEFCRVHPSPWPQQLPGLRPLASRAMARLWPRPCPALAVTLT